jgi:hypothetical protein
MNIDEKELKSCINVEKFYSDELGEPEKRNNGHNVYFCPFHKDEKTPNLAVYSNGRFKCYACEAFGGDLIEFHIKKTEMTFPETLEALAQKYAPDLIKENGNPKRKIKTEYDYKDEKGNLLFQVVRYEPKDFRQRRPDGNSGWIWSTKGIEPIPYRLPELIESDGAVFVVGGEKDADALVELGLAATTNSGGEGNWKPELNQFFENRDVVILEDNDDKGKKYGKIVSENIYGIANSIKIVSFPELPSKGDVSDYLIDHSLKDLMGKIENTSFFELSDKNDDLNDGFENLCPTNSINKQKLSASEKLIRLAEDCELFHDSDGRGYATLPMENHKENWQIKSKGFSRFLHKRFYDKFQKVPNSQAMTDALELIDTKAQYEGSKHSVYIRVGKLNGKNYLDLCNDQWEVVEITNDGWEVISESPVKFIRSMSALPLPNPVQRGAIEDLKEFLNVQDDNDFILVVAFLIAVFRSKGPYLILNVQGEQGSGKSNFSRIIRALIDPSLAPLRSQSNNERDLMISASKSWMLAFDNISKIPVWLSDSLCRISTGGGLSTRKLHSDSDEVIFDSSRPVILNGITEIITRDDLRDRAITINLQPIPDERRMAEEDFWDRFEEAKPKILGALLNAVSAALKNISTIKLDTMSRMADFEKWVCAAVSAFGWDSDEFIKAYRSNRQNAVEIGMDSDPVVIAIKLLASTADGLIFKGSCTQLLDELSQSVSEKLEKTKEWPKSAQVLSNRLQRLAPSLRKIGIDFERGQESGKSGGRRFVILKKSAKSIVAIAASDAKSGKINESKGVSGGDANSAGDTSENSIVPVKPLVNKGGDAGDAGGDEKTNLSKQSEFPWEVSI